MSLTITHVTDKGIEFDEQSGDPDAPSGAAQTMLYAKSDGIYFRRTGGDATKLDAGGGGDVVDDTSPQLGGDLDVNGHDITSASNADIDINPNGTGNVVLKTDLVSVGGGSEVGHISSNGSYDLKLSTNSGASDEGTIVITDGDDQNITLTPAGTGAVAITKIDVAAGEIDGTTIGGNSAAAGTFTTIAAGTSLALATGVTVTGILDEDNMATNSATQLATQQSIKAYVDATAGNATNSAHVLVTDNESTDEDNLITFVENAQTGTGNHGLEMDGNLTYNPSSGKLTATQLAGTLQTAAQTQITSLGTLTALQVDNINIDGNAIISTDTNGNIALTPNGSGEVDISKVDIAAGEIDGAVIGANSAAAGTFTQLTADAFSLASDLTHAGDDNNKIAFGTDTQSFETGGTARMNISDSGFQLAASGERVTTILDEDNMATDSATALATQQSIKAYVDATAGNATNAAHVLVTDNESTDEDNLITFVENAQTGTGNHGLEMDGNLTYNPSTGRLTATQLAGTLQTAAQGQITSLGTLTSLTVDDITIDGHAITATDISIGEDAQTKVDFGTANEIHFYADNAKRAMVDSAGLTLEADMVLEVGESANGGDIKAYSDIAGSFLSFDANGGGTDYGSANSGILKLGNAATTGKGMALEVAGDGLVGAATGKMTWYPGKVMPGLTVAHGTHAAFNNGGLFEVKGHALINSGSFVTTMSSSCLAEDVFMPYGMGWDKNVAVSGAFACLVSSSHSGFGSPQGFGLFKAHESFGMMDESGEVGGYAFVMNGVQFGMGGSDQNNLTHKLRIAHSGSSWGQSYGYDNANNGAMNSGSFIIHLESKDQNNAQKAVGGLCISSSIAPTNGVLFQVGNATHGAAKAKEWRTFSCRDLKHDIQELTGALAKVNAMEARSFKWNTTNQHDIGFIAQEMVEVVPEVCGVDPQTGVAQDIDYGRLTSVLVGAVKEQQAQINELKDVIVKLSNGQEVNAKMGTVKIDSSSEE